MTSIKSPNAQQAKLVMDTISFVYVDARQIESIPIVADPPLTSEELNSARFREASIVLPARLVFDKTATGLPFYLQVNEPIVLQIPTIVVFQDRSATEFMNMFGTSEAGAECWDDKMSIVDEAKVQLDEWVRLNWTAISDYWHRGLHRDIFAARVKAIG